MLSLQETAIYIQKADFILVLSHRSPDGDTLGSAAALATALQRLGKKVKFACADQVSSKFQYLFKDFKQEAFEENYIISVDIADKALLGSLQKNYGEKIDLAIDHHISHKKFAKKTYIDSCAAATCEIIFRILIEMHIEIDSILADALFTGISTDTGCFRYSNITAGTHRIAAKLIEAGCHAADINRVMFDTKSRSRLELEKRSIDGMTFHYKDRCAVITVTLDILAQSRATEDDIEGMSSIPRQMEGVEIGIMLREKEEGETKVSLRTLPGISAADICAHFGGGGHTAAAGCLIHKNYNKAKKELLKVVESYL